MDLDLDYYTLLSEKEKEDNKMIVTKNTFSFENFNSYKDNFDWKKYILNNADLKNIFSKKDAIEHWLNFGIKEKRTLYLLNKEDSLNKEINFDWKKYKNYYKDLKNIHSKKDALIHWEKYGKKENRIFFTFTSKNSNVSNKVEEISDEFNWEIYVNNYDDLKYIDTKENAWKHWLLFGKKEKRVLFDIHEKIKEEYLQLKNNELLLGKELLLYNNQIIFKSIYDNYGIHFFGWKGVMNSFVEYIKNLSLKNTFLLKEKIFFDEWIEKLLIWGNKIKKNEYLKEIVEKQYKIITFLHNPPYEDYYFFSDDEKQEVENYVLFNKDLLNKNVLESIEKQYPIIKNNLIYIYTLSNSHKEWIYKQYPSYRNKIVSIHHPININNSEKLFDFNKFKTNKKIFHIGWWLRNFKTFIDISFPTDFSKNILVKKDFENQWLNFSVNFNLKNINIVYHLNDNEYELLFQNSCIFMDVEDAIANNVILECIKFCTPIIVKKNDSIMEYLGEKYPLYFTSKKDLKRIESFTSGEWLQKILETHEYLFSMNKTHLLLETFNKKVSFDIEKLNIIPTFFKLTWIVIIYKKEELLEMENITSQFINQFSFETLSLVFLIDNQFDFLEEKEFINKKYPYNNISFHIFKSNDNKLPIILNELIQSLESPYFFLPQLNTNYVNNFSDCFIKFMNNNPNCDIGYSSFTHHFSKQEKKIITKIFEKNVFLFKKNMDDLKEDNVLVPLVFRKNILNLCSFQPLSIEFLEKCFNSHFNIVCVAEEILCNNLE